MEDSVRSSLIIAMTDSLSDAELLAGIRILSRILEKKAALPLKTIHLAAGTSKEDWESMKESILIHFISDEKSVTLKDVIEIPKIATEAKEVKTGKTPSLFPSQPKGRKPEAMPSYLAKKAVPITLKKAIYDTGIRLLLAHGSTEKNARSTIANWLKSYPEGTVASALDAARAQGDISDPHSWIVARLRASSRGFHIHPGVEHKGRTPKVSPPISQSADVMSGMSMGSFEKMIGNNETISKTRLGVRTKKASIEENKNDQSS